MYSKKIKQLEAFDKNNQVIFLESIHSEAIIEFYRYYKQLNRIVLEIDDESLNESFLSLRNFFNNLRSAIIPFQEIATEDIYIDINRLFIRITQYKEDIEIENLLNSFGAVISKIKTGIYENKLPRKIMENINNNQKVAIINYYWPLNLKSPFGDNTELIRIKKYLTTEKYYDKAIFIGSPSYYSASYELVNSIQKANKIYYISYDIYSSTVLKKTIIEGNTKKYSKLFSESTIQDNTEKQSLTDMESNEYYDLVVEKSKVNSWVNNLIEQNTDNRDKVSSYVFELESERAIIYPEQGSLYVVNEDDLKVHKVKPIDIKNTQWIVIKSSSEVEYLDRKAAEIVGEHYYDIYKKVIYYKTVLLKRLEKLGSLEALKVELQFNDISTTPQLLRNWIYGDTIAPECYTEILKYLGFESKEINKRVADARTIISARQRAGRNMMKNINNLMSKYEEEEILEEMDSNLYFEFEVPNTGNFIIETVRQRITKKVNVEFKDLYKLHDIHLEDKAFITKFYIE